MSAAGLHPMQSDVSSDRICFFSAPGIPNLGIPNLRHLSFKKLSHCDDVAASISPLILGTMKDHGGEACLAACKVPEGRLAWVHQLPKSTSFVRTDTRVILVDWINNPNCINLIDPKSGKGENIILPKPIHMDRFLTMTREGLIAYAGKGGESIVGGIVKDGNFELLFQHKLPKSLCLKLFSCGEIICSLAEPDEDQFFPSNTGFYVKDGRELRMEKCLNVVYQNGMIHIVKEISRQAYSRTYRLEVHNENHFMDRNGVPEKHFDIEECGILTFIDVIDGKFLLVSQTSNNLGQMGNNKGYFMIDSASGTRTTPLSTFQETEIAYDAHYVDHQKKCVYFTERLLRTNPIPYCLRRLSLQDNHVDAPVPVPEHFRIVHIDDSGNIYCTNKQDS